MEAKATFKNRFVELCGNKTQQEIADAIGISRATVGYYLSGDRSPDIDVLSRIAHYFGVTSDYLIGLSDAKQAENADIVERLGLSERTIEEIIYLAKNKGEEYIVDDELPPITQLNMLDFLLYAIIRDSDMLSNMAIACEHMSSARFEKYKASEFLFQPSKEDKISFFDLRKLVMDHGCQIIGGLEMVELRKYRLEQSFRTALKKAIEPYEKKYMEYVIDEKIERENSHLDSFLEILSSVDSVQFKSIYALKEDANLKYSNNKELLLRELNRISDSLSLLLYELSSTNTDE